MCLTVKHILSSLERRNSIAVYFVSRNGAVIFGGFSFNPFTTGFGSNRTKISPTLNVIRPPFADLTSEITVMQPELYLSRISVTNFYVEIVEVRIWCLT